MEKNLPANAGDTRDVGSILIQYSRLENPMDREALSASVHRLAESHTRLKRLSTHAQTGR